MYISCSLFLLLYSIITTTFYFYSYELRRIVLSVCVNNKTQETTCSNTRTQCTTKDIERERKRNTNRETQRRTKREREKEENYTQTKMRTNRKHYVRYVFVCCSFIVFVLFHFLFSSLTTAIILHTSLDIYHIYTQRKKKSLPT